MTFVEFEWLFLAIMATLIAFAFGDQRGRQRSIEKRQQLADRTADASKRRWASNGLALEIFERAFSDHTAGCARQCDCGIQFYNPDQTWDFEKGELDGYYKDPAARALEWSVESLYFEGRYFVPDCECWKARAIKIVAFVDHHDHQIADYLSLKKKSLELAAERSPVLH